MLRPMFIGPVPPETARGAQTAFPTGNRDLRLADARDTLFTDDAFLALFPTHGQPALPPWRLALVTLLPFAEGLSDRQAAHAVRSRLDWKTSCAWSSQIRGSMRRSSVNFAADCWPGRRSICSSTPCSPGAAIAT
jgi:transposase